MSIFTKIKNAIFGKAEAGTEASTTGASPTLDTAPAPKTGSIAGRDEPDNGAASASAPASDQVAKPSVTATQTPAAQPASSDTAVDVEALLNDKVKASGQKLNWRTSIVDLMKALGMEASLSERKELADELGYTGDKGDSAAMNIWLHKALLKKLAENGGKVPADLLD